MKKLALAWTNDRICGSWFSRREERSPRLTCLLRIDNQSMKLPFTGPPKQAPAWALCKEGRLCVLCVCKALIVALTGGEWGALGWLSQDQGFRKWILCCIKFSDIWQQQSYALILSSSKFTHFNSRKLRRSMWSFSFQCSTWTVSKSCRSRAAQPIWSCSTFSRLRGFELYDRCFFSHRPQVGTSRKGPFRHNFAEWRPQSTTKYCPSELVALYGHWRDHHIAKDLQGWICTLILPPVAHSWSTHNFSLWGTQWAAVMTLGLIGCQILTCQGICQSFTEPHQEAHLSSQEHWPAPLKLRKQLEPDGSLLVCVEFVKARSLCGSNLTTFQHTGWMQGIFTAGGFGIIKRNVVCCRVLGTYHSDYHLLRQTVELILLCSALRRDLRLEVVNIFGPYHCCMQVGWSLTCAGGKVRILWRHGFSFANIGCLAILLAELGFSHHLLTGPLLSQQVFRVSAGCTVLFSATTPS